MNDDIAVKVAGVHKSFLLPHKKHKSVKLVFTNLFSREEGHIEVQHALRDISFEIKKGEFFGIVGRNGSGKSTLLKMLAGIYQPTKGSIGVNGRLVPFIELGVGFNPELTGRENVYLNGALLGFSNQQIDEQYQRIVDFAELGRFMDQKLKNYSSGMQVRLAFSVATTAQADILLVDEVLAVGDADFQRKCFEYFRELKKNKTTVVFVTHDMDAVREYCDRAILIEKSELVASGSPAKIATRYARMFMDPEEVKAAEKVEKSKRWGDKRMTFTSVKVTPPRLTDKDKPVEIELEVTAHADIERPLIGFSIDSPTGQPLVGTNTKLQQVETGDLQEGDRLRVTFTLPNIFADGQYTLNVAAETGNGTVVCDRWEEAKIITVLEENPLWFTVSPHIATTVKKV